jgi:DNA-binding MarR family transcriptional regulator
MTDRLPVTGQEIGAAQRAIEPLLDAILSEVGTDYLTWVTINTLAGAGDAMPPAVLERDLAVALRADPFSIRDQVKQMAAAGLVDAGAGTVGAEVRLTAAGKKLHQRVREAIAHTSSRLYAGLDADDLAITRRVLVEVTKRARSLLAT